MGLASLCISNRALFLNLASRSVYGSSGHAFRSLSSSSFATTTNTTSTFAYSFWRASWPYRFRPPPIRIPTYHGHLNHTRAASWATRFNLRPPPGSLNDADTHEEPAQAAVLEAIKGRQQTDLMLRCESAAHIAVSQTRSQISSPHST